MRAASFSFLARRGSGLSNPLAMLKEQWASARSNHKADTVTGRDRAAIAEGPFAKPRGLAEREKSTKFSLCGHTDSSPSFRTASVTTEPGTGGRDGLPAPRWTPLRA